MQVHLLTHTADHQRSFDRKALTKAIAEKYTKFGSNEADALELLTLLQKSPSKSLNFDEINQNITTVTTNSQNCSASSALDLLALVRSSIRTNPQCEELSAGLFTNTKQIVEHGGLKKVAKVFNKLKREGKVSVLALDYKASKNEADLCPNQDLPCPFTNCSIQINGREYTLIPKRNKKIDSVSIELFNRYGKRVAQLAGIYQTAPFMYSDDDNLYLLYSKNNKSYMKTICLNKKQEAQEIELQDLDLGTLDPRNTQIYKDNVWLFDQKNIRFIKINKQNGKASKIKLNLDQAEAGTKIEYNPQIRSQLSGILASPFSDNFYFHITQETGGNRTDSDLRKNILLDQNLKLKDSNLFEYSPNSIESGKLSNRFSISAKEGVFHGLEIDKDGNTVINTQQCHEEAPDKGKIGTKMPFIVENSSSTTTKLTSYSADARGNLYLSYHTAEQDYIVKISPEAHAKLSSAWAEILPE